MTYATSVANARCIQCNGEIVDAWVCIGCAMVYDSHRSDDLAWSSPSTCGRRQQQLRDRAAIHEQFIDLQTVIDQGVRLAEHAHRSGAAPRRAGADGRSDSDHARSHRLLHLRRLHSDPKFSREDVAKIYAFTPESSRDVASGNNFFDKKRIRQVRRIRFAARAA